MNSYQVVPIGWVESPLTDRAQAPRQGHEGAPDAWLVFEPGVADGIHDFDAGTEVLVLTWLDRAARDVLVTRPRDDPARPPTGVFSTRSADRPNPIGPHPRHRRAAGADPPAGSPGPDAGPRRQARAGQDHRTVTADPARQITNRPLVFTPDSLGRSALLKTAGKAI